MSQAITVSEALEIIKQAMINDRPEQSGRYAHSWHSNIAMMCYDAIRENSKNQLGHETCYEIANDAASRFMKLCFGVDTTA